MASYPGTLENSGGGLVDGRFVRDSFSDYNQFELKFNTPVVVGGVLYIYKGQPADVVVESNFFNPFGEIEARINDLELASGAFLTITNTTVPSNAQIGDIIAYIEVNVDDATFELSGPDADKLLLGTPQPI
jgi:hypothetical protein